MPESVSERMRANMVKRLEEDIGTKLKRYLQYAGVNFVTKPCCGLLDEFTKDVRYKIINDSDMYINKLYFNINLQY